MAEWPVLSVTVMVTVEHSRRIGAGFAAASAGLPIVAAICHEEGHSLLTATTSCGLRSAAHTQVLAGGGESARQRPATYSSTTGTDRTAIRFNRLARISWCR